MSAKEFSGAKQNFKPEGDNAIKYQQAEKVWDERIGTSAASAFNWRVFALICMVANMILSGGLIYQSSKSTVVPYVVQTGADGHAQSVKLAQEAIYEPKEAEIKYFIEHFVQDIRSIPLDPVVAAKQWNNAYGFLRSAARTKMAEELRKDNLKGRLGLETSQVQVRNTVQQSPNTYQVRWTEEVFGKDGSLKERYNMSGSFTIEFAVPSSEKEVRHNPLGLYIKGFSWAREL